LEGLFVFCRTPIHGLKRAKTALQAARAGKIQTDLPNNPVFPKKEFLETPQRPISWYIQKTFFKTSPTKKSNPLFDFS
jgi:hypothetical protein